MAQKQNEIVAESIGSKIRWSYHLLPMRFRAKLTDCSLLLFLLYNNSVVTTSDVIEQIKCFTHTKWLEQSVH